MPTRMVKRMRGDIEARGDKSHPDPRLRRVSAAAVAVTERLGARTIIARRPST
jgi:hypothetical protein